MVIFIFFSLELIQMTTYMLYQPFILLDFANTNASLNVLI